MTDHRTEGNNNSPLKEDGKKIVFDAIRVEYRDMASWYDSFWKNYTNKTLKEPLRQVLNEKTNKYFTLVDVGSGTGEFLRRLKNHYENDDDSDDTIASNDKSQQQYMRINDESSLDHHQKWIGIEPSKEMLEKAEGKFNKNKANDAVAVLFKESPAEQLPIKDDFADIVVSTNAFHFFRNKDVALQEMERVLINGGKLIITDWCNDYWLVKFYHFLERLRWNWRFKDRYPGPLTTTELLDMVNNTEGFSNVRVSKYRVRVFSIFFWGMQTVTAQKK